MKHITDIHSNGIPNSIEIFNDQVLVPENVRQFQEETADGVITEYIFDGNVYTKDEYIILMAQQTGRITELEDELKAAKILLGVDE